MEKNNHLRIIINVYYLYFDLLQGRRFEHTKIWAILLNCIRLTNDNIIIMYTVGVAGKT